MIIMHLPRGYRFIPTDFQLIRYYLLPRIMGEQLPCSIIKDIELYKYDPDQLPVDTFKNCCRDDEAYFFANIERRYPKGKVHRRTTLSGYWKNSGGEKLVHDEKNEVVGYKTTLVFYWGKTSSGTKTRWIMYEYRVNPQAFAATSPMDEGLRARMESYNSVPADTKFHSQEFRKQSIEY
ncbi:hypothetical protein Tsubulata_044606 [Turnera subulata]|uniref:NAC domain-containing protein n=1 Tax=Turnera subulata TaxID=218843 RepID=A0A9Q0JHY2_9ROSI|nr:hypothetical protein Tsubulata_044606 [Turnera subulata]